MGMYDLAHIVAQQTNGAKISAHITYFHPIDPRHDPTRTYSISFPTFSNRMTSIPSHTTPATIPPVHLAHARRYPDATDWITAYNEAFHKFHRDNIVGWDVLVPHNPNPLPSTMECSYKWYNNATTCVRKAHFPTLVGLMRTGKHFDLLSTQFPTAYNATSRLLFAITATHGWPIDNKDIKNSYVHEPVMFNAPILSAKFRTATAMTYMVRRSVTFSKCLGL